eukprot:m.40751 g.40751  ORF g.40751 m.40751 type:complete len:503 (+) comp10390_c0_seq1:113-1621(+)
MGAAAGRQQSTEHLTHARIHYVVEFVSAENVPRTDILSESDPFLRARIVLAAGGQACSPWVRTPVLWNNPQPVWRSFRDFGFIPNDDEHALRVELWDAENFKKNQLIGTAMVPVTSLSEGETKVFPVKLQPNIKPHPDRPPATVTLRRIIPREEEKVVFLIRHGESEWNAAVSDMALHKMLAQVDHPLNTVGVNQAQRLASLWHQHRHREGDCEQQQQQHEEEGSQGQEQGQEESEAQSSQHHQTPPEQQPQDQQQDRQQDQQQEQDQQQPPVPEPDARSMHISEFVGAEAVLCSPLTRAVQTALVALHAHPTLTRRGLVLLPPARELKRSYAVDVVGGAVGEEIVSRCLVLLERASPGISAACRLEEIKGCVDASAAEGTWWTRLHSTDSPTAIALRLHDVLCRIRYSPARSVILVGHSLFFRELLKQHLSPTLAHTDPALAARLTTHKLSNAGVLRVTMRWDTPHAHKCIQTADLLFESSLLPPAPDRLPNMCGTDTVPL